MSFWLWGRYDLSSHYRQILLRADSLLSEPPGTPPLVPDQGSNSHPPTLEGKILSTGPPGKSQQVGFRSDSGVVLTVRTQDAAWIQRRVPRWHHIIRTSICGTLKDNLTMCSPISSHFIITPAPWGRYSLLLTYRWENWGKDNLTCSSPYRWVICCRAKRVSLLSLWFHLPCSNASAICLTEWHHILCGKMWEV